MDTRQRGGDGSGQGTARRADVAELSVVRCAKGSRLPEASSWSGQNDPRAAELSDLLSARDYVALLVDRHGAQYLPLFVRLDEEIATRHASQSLVERARRLARSAAAQSDAA